MVSDEANDDSRSICNITVNQDGLACHTRTELRCQNVFNASIATVQCSFAETFGEICSPEGRSDADSIHHESKFLVDRVGHGLNDTNDPDDVRG